MLVEQNGVGMPETCPVCGADLREMASVYYSRNVAAITHLVPASSGKGLVIDEMGIDHAPNDAGEDWATGFQAVCRECGNVLAEQSMDWG